MLTNEYIADSQLAFLQGKYEESLRLAKYALAQDDQSADAHQCAGNAYMSFGDYESAIKHYKRAVENDVENGDRCFNLGYAYAAANYPTDALAMFAKADEMGCSPNVVGQLYKIMAMLCFDLHQYEDAILNFIKAEKMTGIDMDILERKALSYSMSGDTSTDTTNREPLFYEEYAGSIVDISQLQYILEKARGYGYKKVGFILDRGYFSRENIEYMDKCNYDFIIMVKGMAPLVNELVLECKGTFENKRDCNIRKYGVYGTTVKRKLYAADEKDRYFHIYYNDSKKAAEHEAIEVKIEKIAEFLKKKEGRVYEPSDRITDYFEPFIDEKDNVFLFAREKKEVIEREIDLCGYFCIVTSQKMIFQEALELYKSRDASEKLFRGDKSYLGNKSMRVYTDESVSAKIFIEFVALIIRSRFYTLLKDENEKLESRQNYMTVPAAIRELEKIEMIRGMDRIYRLDHAITATQKTILGAFGINVPYIKDRVNRISEQLKIADEKK